MIKKLVGICGSLILFACSSSSGFDANKSDLALNTTAIETVGSNEITVYNTGKTPITINKVSIEDKTTTQTTTDKDSIDDALSTCNNAKVYENQSCKIMLIVNKGKTGSDFISLDTDIGAKKYEIKINTPVGDLEITPTTMNNVGNTKFTIINNRNTAITLNSVFLANNNTLDTSTDLANCFGKKLEPSETCQFNVKGFVGESGSNIISVATNNKTYTYNVVVNTPANDLQLDNTVIAESGINNINLINKGSGTIKIKVLSFSPQSTYDTADVTNCTGKTLIKDQSCLITVTSLEKIAGVDNIVTITDVGDYSHEIRVDTTGAGILATDDSANIKTTKETSVKVYNKGALPLTLKSLTLQSDIPKSTSKTNQMLRAFGLSSTDDIIVQDSTCLNKALNSGEICEIKAKSKGNTNKDNIVNFSSTNQYMKSQPVFLSQDTIQNKLTFYSTDSSTTPITDTALDAPVIKTFYVKNDGTNDMNIKGVSLSNTMVGNVVGDGCSGKNIYATESCSVQVQVANDAHSKVFLQVDTEQPQPNNQLLLAVNNKSLAFSDNSKTGTMPTNIQKSFTITNPNSFDVNISNVINDSTSYAIIDNQCVGKIPANGTCTMVAKSNNNSGTSKLTLVSDNFTTPQELTMKVNNGINITSAVTGGAFISAFIVVNDNPENGIMTITNNAGGSFVQNGQNPEWFAGSTNCMQYNNSIPSGTKCKYMLSLPSNDPSSNFGNVTFDFKYDSGDNVLQTFAPFVTRRTVNVPATYQPNQTINATQYVQYNNYGIPNSLATYVENYTGQPYQKCNDKKCWTVQEKWSRGFLLKVGNDGVTLNATFFDGQSTNQLGCPVDNFGPFEVTNIPTTVSGANSFFALSPTTVPALDNRWLSWFTQSGTGCNNGVCNIILTGNVACGGGASSWFTGMSSGGFTQPVTAQNYTVIDNVTWNAQ